MQFIIDPDSTHGVVDSRIDHHGYLVGIIVGNLLIHLEKVAIFFLNHIFTKALNGIFEIQEYGQAC